MKRNKVEESVNQRIFSASNNTNAIGGYDAYFVIYEMIEITGKVAHTLTGSIATSNIICRIQLPGFWYIMVVIATIL